MNGVRRVSPAYQPRTKTQKEHPTGWGTPSSDGAKKRPAKDPTPWYRRFFRWALWLCLIAVIFAVVSFLRGGTGISSRLVDISIVAPTFADGGSPVTVDVFVQNRNRAQIETAKLFVSYAAPRPDEPEARQTVERDLGTLAAGERKNESVPVTLFGPEGTERVIEARVEFHVAQSRATFSKTGEHTITIRSSPVRLTVENPAVAVPNQPVTLTIKVSPNTTDPLGRTIVHIKTPGAWTFQQAAPSPSIGSDTWDLGELPAGQEQVIKVTGTLSGAPGELQTITVSVGQADPDDTRNIGVLYQERPVVMELSRSFLDASLSVGDDSGSTVSIPPGGARVKVIYRNPSATPIDRGVITIALGGPALYADGVDTTEGFFDTNARTITYSFTNIQELARIEPGEEGDFTFELTPNPQTQSANRYLTVDASVSGAVGGVDQTVNGIDTMRLVASADARLLSDTLSQTGSIQNTGPIPPRVGTKTQYTLKWKVSGITSALRDVTVRTTLPSYVTWTNAKVVSTGTIAYNTSTREVTWTIPTITAGTEPESAIQVAITPSASQQGSVVPLSGVISLSGQDASLLTAITQTRPAHTTTLTGAEASVSSGVVAPAGG